MMTATELTDHLRALRLAPDEAADLLGVSARSLRRWAEGEGVPGPAAAALRAWRALDDRHLPWKPDTISIFRRDRDQMDRMREHDVMLNEVLTQVEARGGPRHAWSVDIPRGRATLGQAEVGFHRLLAGGFSPSTYRRVDGLQSDADRPAIEDAVYCIAQAFTRARNANAALLALAEYLQAKPQTFVRDGREVLSDNEVARRTRLLASAAEGLIHLAEDALDGPPPYSDIEALLTVLHRIGVYPPNALVGAVADSLLGPITLDRHVS